MSRFDDLFAWALERRALAVIGAVVAVAFLVVLVKGVRLSEPGLPVAKRRSIKEEVVRILRGEYRGLKCEALALKLAVKPRQLMPLLRELVEDRFLLTEGEAGDPVFRLRGAERY